jgi:hypothetical protein
MCDIIKDYTILGIFTLLLVALGSIGYALICTILNKGKQ